MWMLSVIFYFYFLRTSSAGGRGGAARLFFFFPCSADHDRDWPPCKVVFSGWQPINALNVRNNGKCHEEVLYFQLLIPPKRFDIFSPWLGVAQKVWVRSDFSLNNNSNNHNIVPPWNLYYPIVVFSHLNTNNWWKIHCKKRTTDGQPRVATSLILEVKGTTEKQKICLISDCPWCFVFSGAFFFSHV